MHAGMWLLLGWTQGSDVIMCHGGQEEDEVILGRGGGGREGIRSCHKMMWKGASHRKVTRERCSGSQCQRESISWPCSCV